MGARQNRTLCSTAHYLPEEIDDECERQIRAFLTKKYGKVEFPIKTDDLTAFIERKGRPRLLRRSIRRAWRSGRRHGIRASQATGGQDFRCSQCSEHGEPVAHNAHP